MKMLKKLAALILAATMALVLFTACSGDGGSTGTREPEKKKLHSSPSLRIIAWPPLQRSMIRSCRLWRRST